MLFSKACKIDFSLAAILISMNKVNSLFSVSRASARKNHCEAVIPQSECNCAAIEQSASSLAHTTLLTHISKFVLFASATLANTSTKDFHAYWRNCICIRRTIRALSTHGANFLCAIASADRSRTGTHAASIGRCFCFISRLVWTFPNPWRTALGPTWSTHPVSTWNFVQRREHLFLFAFHNDA